MLGKLILISRRKEIHKFLGLIRHHPVEGLSMVTAMMRGGFYILKYYLISRGRIKIDFPFFCYTHIRISGKGQVRIGGGCSVFVNNFERLIVHTLTQDAVVTIGEKCSLGGGTIRCSGQVQIGNRVMMAANLIQDIPFCSSFAHDEIQVDLRISPIFIGNYVWLGSRSIVLGQSRVGDKSVIGAGTVLCGQSVGEGYLVLGNPPRRPLSLTSLMRMRSSNT